MRAGNDFTQCRTGRGLAASRRPFGDARLPVRHCAAGAEVPPRHQTTQPKNEVLTSNRDLTHDSFVYGARADLVQRFREFRDTPASANLYCKFNVKEKSGWDIRKGHLKLQEVDSIEDFIQPLALRPFDKTCIFYHDDLVWRSVRKIFSNFLQGENLGLCLIRINSKDNNQPVFVTDAITDKTILSSKDNANVFPLYLYEENMGTVEKRPNMDKAIVAKIEAAVCGKLTPEAIFHYIYGVLHSPVYRAKFKEFLKSDFPRIPYPKDTAQFEAFAKIGKMLVNAHLLRDAAPGLSETRARFPKTGSNEVERVERDDEGRVWINAYQFFSNVPERAWAMPIGGYNPAQKWLKDRKGRVLSLDDRKHYQRIVVALEKTAEAMDDLAALG